MTYEPGQQVLVRGVIQATEPVSARLKGTHLIEFSNSPSYGAWIAPADVVGPAPATPDEGSDRLAAVEAERDATNALISSARISLDQVTAERDAYRATLASVQEWCAARRHNPYDYVRDTVHEITAVLDRHRHTLSVEATGTEGGGGHG
jgi:hypothetical protein